MQALSGITEGVEHWNQPHAVATEGKNCSLAAMWDATQHNPLTRVSMKQSVLCAISQIVKQSYIL